MPSDEQKMPASERRCRHLSVRITQAEWVFLQRARLEQGVTLQDLVVGAFERAFDGFPAAEDDATMLEQEEA